MQPGAAHGVAMAGREWERAELASAIEQAGRGTGRAVLVLGEAGMGKSTLADWLVALSRDAGVRCARGGCSAAGMPALWRWRRHEAAAIRLAGP